VRGKKIERREAAQGINRGGEQNRPQLRRTMAHSVSRRSTMTQQFQNPVETKVENESKTGTSTQKKIDSIADDAAAKPAKTEKKYDKDNSQLFSK
jgi:hypothetical protein